MVNNTRFEFTTSVCRLTAQTFKHERSVLYLRLFTLFLNRKLWNSTVYRFLHLWVHRKILLLYCLPHKFMENVNCKKIYNYWITNFLAFLFVNMKRQRLYFLTSILITILKERINGDQIKQNVVFIKKRRSLLYKSCPLVHQHKGDGVKDQFYLQLIKT